LNLDGQTGHSSISLGDGGSCSIFSFTVPSSLTDDITFDFSTDDSSFTIEEMDLILDKDWTSKTYTQSFSFPGRYLAGTGSGFTIPYCALSVGKWWIVGVIVGTPVTTMAIRQVTATPPLTGSISGYSMSGLPIVDSDVVPFYYFLQIPTNLEQSHLVNMSVSANNPSGVTVWGSDIQCPTEAYYQGTTDDQIAGATATYNLLRTTSQESTLYFVVKIDVYDISHWSLNLTYDPISCQVPTAEPNYVCPVKYPTYPYDFDTISNIEDLVSFIDGLLQEADVPPSCEKTVIALACASAFPKCDSNGYSLYPCQQTCDDLTKVCTESSYVTGDYVFSPSEVACTGYPANTGTFCYSSGNMKFTASYTILMVALIFLFL